MHNVVRLTVGTSWRRSRGCYSQNRLMLWANAPSVLVSVGRRVVPPGEPEPWTQPGRERPHAARQGPASRRVEGVAHVPVAPVTDLVDLVGSARERAVHSTREWRPVSTAIVVTPSVSRSSGEYFRVSA